MTRGFVVDGHYSDSDRVQVAKAIGPDAVCPGVPPALKLKRLDSGPGGTAIGAAPHHPGSRGGCGLVLIRHHQWLISDGKDAGGGMGIKALHLTAWHRI
jgi:hypothetical protein